MERSPIKTRILKIGVLCGICVMVLLVCYFKTLKINQKKQETFEKLNSLSTILHQINVLERDFFESESKKPAFYAHKTSQLTNQYANLYAKLEDNVKSLNKGLLPKQKINLMHYERNLETEINKHSQLWDSAQFYVRKRGFKDFGLEGKMRSEIHFVEQNCPLPNLELVLMLRRHEKDFFLRKETNYVGKVSKTLRILENKVQALNIDSKDKKLYLLALDHYWIYFAEIVAIENKIGLDREGGIRFEIVQQMEAIEKDIKMFKSALELNAEHQIYLINCLYLVAIILLIIALILSLFTSKELGKPIKNLVDSIQISINSNFDHNLSIYPIEGNSEIAVLSNNVQKMLSKIIYTRSALIQTQLKLRKGNQKLIEQSELLKETFHLLETKNKHLVSSIDYAKKIQNVFLPSDAKIQSIFEKTELIYLPKDIIGGDFYTAFECDNNKFMIAMDCTGHGVPGAFMTILGATIISSLKKIISCADDPSSIMEKFDKLFRELFASEEFATQDGMEVAIVSVNKLTNQVKFCGSKLHLVVQNNKQITLIKGSKKGIGEPARIGHIFADVVLDLEIGDRFYLMTDGLQDQFGGTNSEKLKRKQILKTLASNKDNSLPTQIDAVRLLLNDWMNAHGEKTTQTDDILMIGVEI